MHFLKREKKYKEGACFFKVFIKTRTVCTCLHYLKK
jgi:hypothetical protein